MVVKQRNVLPILVLGVVVLLAAFHRSAPPAQPTKKLAHFEGIIDYSKQTHDPVKSDLYVRAAQALEAGGAAAAEALYRKVVDRYPDDPDGYTALGACLSFQNRNEEARAEYEHALRLDPGSRNALYGLGSVAYGQERDQEAVGHLEAVLAAHPTDAPAHRLLAFAYDALEDGPNALLHYTRAAELNPRFAAEEHIRQRLAALKR